MKILSLSISRNKGTSKASISEAVLKKEHGFEGDAHAGSWHRQVSFLAAESIEQARCNGLDVSFGDFAENIATEGVDWQKVPVGTMVRLGATAVVEITQIGKECHKRCAIYYKAGDCIMPREGVFGRVLEGGIVRCGDSIHMDTVTDSAQSLDSSALQQE
ncbi:MAG: MOSC domain-containing protein [Syntrophobacteraceae bacterium]|nr:MOSC domain-containing protein [Syntrophobacteraceae bacterium]